MSQNIPVKDKEHFENYSNSAEFVFFFDLNTILFDVFFNTSTASIKNLNLL